MQCGVSVTLWPRFCPILASYVVSLDLQSDSTERSLSPREKERRWSDRGTDAEGRPVGDREPLR